ncbi:MAG: hypothetical protein UX26_C0018G0007 [Parcubacteria group bacterium GW2011_GWC1_45_9]|uniref:HEAT repeat domain-containing protein n=1 Tax=Candidatus Woesebacteria bacterium GW2011_GWB1_44_11b TaxID=1618580 RepID=A0A0G1GID0_9BACT|nr:MAG: hypothetical protein UW21_C0004G0008 [Candidatus Woesebacteria bacterium GW2011_GWB1_44_11b]KKT86426.1 MAG: hypothetical protein UW85_C0002G0027 [Parcubacteria group bacterium GW2011_GWA1_Parcubacteria_45_10]KKU16685.1 MAG: hypothetical protein UX26_C0018G0007 [Parcubacteria group bacterium GW2011_GWC1_45_9]
MVYKKGEFEKITFSKGYYWSAVKELQDSEKLFLKNIPGIKKSLLISLGEEKSAKRKSFTLHLLGWSRDYIVIPKVLTSYFKDRNISVANAAARAFFPMFASGKTNLPLEKVLKLLGRRNKYLKNKALGILAFSNRNDLLRIKKTVRLSYLKHLLDSGEPMISEPAKLLFQKISRIRS